MKATKNASRLDPIAIKLDKDYIRKSHTVELKTATARAKAKLCSQRTVIEGCLIRNNLIEPDNTYGVEKYGTVIAFPMTDEETSNRVKDSMQAAFERKRDKLTENDVEPNFEDVILPIDDSYFFTLDEDFDEITLEDSN